ncbi:MAG: site-specific integrase [Lautropia sp.]|nr:site-specific integrase [Lautropia sp.]MDL1907794.1 site-specific integrase [Betaproteobacteria bacterium PRO1]RIK89389.1 MAG: hypothetical protein DCC70_08165 [Burkholderiales bacterium]
MYSNYRYFPLPPNNVLTGWQQIAPGRYVYGSAMLFTLTYRQLLETAAAQTPAGQVQRNRKSALRRTMAILGRKDHDSAYADLCLEFDGTLKAMTDSGRFKERRLADMRGHLRWWSSLAASVSNPRRERVEPRPASAFTRALQHAFSESGLTKSGLATSASMSPMTLGDWLRGRQPRTETRDALERVEKTLGLGSGTLSRLVRWADSGGAPSGQLSAYRKRVHDLQQDPYRLPLTAFSPALLAQWQSLLARQTGTIASDVPLSRRAGWSVKSETMTRVKPTVLTKIAGGVCPSAEVIGRKVQGLLGFLARARTRGGAGYPISEVQTLAWLAVPEAVDGYFDFVVTRSGKVNNQTLGMTSFILSLLDARTGWLRHHPEYAATLPETVTARLDWVSACDKTSEICLKWRKRFAGRSRHPKTAIASVLSGDDALERIWRGVASLDAEADTLPRGSVRRAGVKRDALILALLTCIPLRVETLATLQCDGSTGGDHIYRLHGQFRLSACNLKNRHRDEGETVDVALPDILTGRIDEYLREHLPHIVGSTRSRYLFPSTRNPQRVWRTMNGHIIAVTRRHVPDCPGFGPHALRHVVASNYLRRHPNEHTLVAKLLLVSLDTVLTFYDQSGSDYALALHARDLEQAAKRASRGH